MMLWVIGDATNPTGDATSDIKIISRFSSAGQYYCMWPFIFSPVSESGSTKAWLRWLPPLAWPSAR
jgi:hypothetical protein